MASNADNDHHHNNNTCCNDNTITPYNADEHGVVDAREIQAL